MSKSREFEHSKQVHDFVFHLNRSKKTPNEFNELRAHTVREWETELVFNK